MSQKKIPDPTFRDIAIAALEQINDLCQHPAWLESRKKILEVSHEAVQILSKMEDTGIELNEDELRDILTALRYVQFAATSTTAYWEPLVARLRKISDKRDGVNQ